MVSVKKLALLGVSLVILSLFITTVMTPVLNNTKLQDNEYKRNAKGQLLDAEDYVIEEYPDDNLKPVITKPAINVTGVTTFNLIISLFPLFLGVGGLLAIIQKFKNKG